MRAVDSATVCPICGDRRTSKLDLGIHVADEHSAAEVEARVQAAANQRAVEVRRVVEHFQREARSREEDDVRAGGWRDVCEQVAAALASPAPAPAETPTQPDRDTGYGQPEAECRRVHRFRPETGWACRQEMVNGGRTVCGCGAVFFHHRGSGQWSCVRCGQPPRQPQAAALASPAPAPRPER